MQVLNRDFIPARCRNCCRRHPAIELKSNRPGDGTTVFVLGTTIIAASPTAATQHACVDRPGKGLVTPLGPGKGFAQGQFRSVEITGQEMLGKLLCARRGFKNLAPGILPGAGRSGEDRFPVNHGSSVRIRAD